MSISGYPVQQTSRVSALKFIRRFHTSVRFAIPTSIIPGIVSSVILNRASIMKSFLALRTEKRQVFTTLTLQWAFFFFILYGILLSPVFKVSQVCRVKAGHRIFRGKSAPSIRTKRSTSLVHTENWLNSCHGLPSLYDNHLHRSEMSA